MQEVATMAAALGCPPVALLYQLEDDDVEMLPGQTRSAFHAAQWFSGLWTLDSAEAMTGREETKPDKSVRILLVLREYVSLQESRRTLKRLIARTADEPIDRLLDDLQYREEKIEEHAALLQRMGVNVPTNERWGVA